MKKILITGKKWRRIGYLVSQSSSINPKKTKVSLDISLECCHILYGLISDTASAIMDNNETPILCGFLIDTNGSTESKNSQGV